MTPQELKLSIIHLAMRGKLVDQCPADEPAQILLSRISAEKKGKGISVMGVNLRDVNKSMINMAMGFTLKRALMMLGGKFTKEQVLKINDDLNKIKKKKQKREKV